MIYKEHEFDEDTFPLPLVCLPYMIVEPISDGTFTAIKINDETIRKSLTSTEFCSSKHRVIDGHLRPTKSWYVVGGGNNFIKFLGNLG